MLRIVLITGTVMVTKRTISFLHSSDLVHGDIGTNSVFYSVSDKKWLLGNLEFGILKLI
jgi:tRNA A-37 threonylcarbamoyl transferase component Bud32